MAENRVYYKGGYKYQLHENYQVSVGIRPDHDITSDYISLDRNGLLVLKKGYAWDGPSGPTVDTDNFIRGSLVHDALYQLMRMNHLSTGDHRKSADEELKRLCLEDGMSSIRAWWVYESVRQFGGRAASSNNTKPVLAAPRQDNAKVATDTDLSDQYTQ
jgi:hypothetical protein